MTVVGQPRSRRAVIAAKIAPAPDMSSFMRACIASDGLRLMPPASYMIPLPTSATRPARCPVRRVGQLDAAGLLGAPGVDAEQSAEPHPGHGGLVEHLDLRARSPRRSPRRSRPSASPSGGWPGCCRGRGPARSPGRGSRRAGRPRARRRGARVVRRGSARGGAPRSAGRGRPGSGSGRAGRPRRRPARPSAGSSAPSPLRSATSRSWRIGGAGECRGRVTDGRRVEGPALARPRSR